MGAATPPPLMRWDTLPVANTRPAMRGAVPTASLIPMFFGPCILVLLTFKVWLLLLVPAIWFGLAAMYAKNFNRPREWSMYFLSGTAFMSWRPWGGASFDPHGSPSNSDMFL